MPQFGQRMARIERDVDLTRPERAEDRGNEVRTLFDEQTNGLGPVSAKIEYAPGDPSAFRIQLAIGEGLRLRRDGDGTLNLEH